MHWLVLSLSLYALKFHNSPPQAANSATLPTNLSFHFPFHHCCCCSGRTATMNLCLCLLPSTGAGSRKKLPSAFVSPVYTGSLATGRQTMAPAGCAQHTPVGATRTIGFLWVLLPDPSPHTTGTVIFSCLSLILKAKSAVRSQSGFALRDEWIYSHTGSSGDKQPCFGWPPPAPGLGHSCIAPDLH